MAKAGTVEVFRPTMQMTSEYREIPEKELPAYEAAGWALHNAKPEAPALDLSGIQQG